MGTIVNTSTSSYTINPTGTIDYTALCGQNCPDCPDCCGITCGACTGIPTTLHATATSTGTDCACLLNKVWTLTWDSVLQHWKGSLEIDGVCADPLPTTFLNLTLSCSGGAFALKIDDLGGTSQCLTSRNPFPSTTPSSTTCSPFQIVFLSISITDCCSGPHGPTVVWTVTP